MRGFVKGSSVAGEIEHIRAAFQRAAAAIFAGPDPEQALREATMLGELTAQVRGEAADFRGYLAATFVDAKMMTIPDIAALLNVTDERARQLVRDGRRKGNPVTDPGTDPEPPTVALAIITGPHGVLIERRNDGRPPWTFPAGELLAGESPAAAIARRVPEETGLSITPGHIIGRRIHPKTLRAMCYLTAQAQEGEPVVGDPDDLAEVRWASVEETRELMPDMFPPVRAYLDGLDLE